MSDTRPSPALLRVVVGALLAAFLIENSTDVAVWAHCGWRAAATPCTDATALTDVKLTGLAVGGLLSVAVTAALAHRRRKAHEALAVIMGVLAAALFTIFDVSVGTAGYPEPGEFDTALYIWVVVSAGFVVVAASPWQADRPLLPFAELCAAALAAGLLVVAAFPLAVWAGWAPAVWGESGYLRAYAVAAAPAGWAAMLCALQSGRVPGASRVALLVLLTAALCFGYGFAVGWSSGTGYATGAPQPRFAGGMGSLLLLGGGVALAVGLRVAASRGGVALWLAVAATLPGAAALAASVLALAGPQFAAAQNGTWVFVAETVVALGLASVATLAAPAVVDAGARLVKGKRWASA